MTSLLVIMLISVNTVENMPLISTEFDQSGYEFMHFNQKHNKRHYQECLERKKDDSLESMCNRVST